MSEIVIKEIEKAEIAEMVEIWNQHFKVLIDNRRKHTVETLSKWLETQHEINNIMFGLIVDETLKGFIILHYEEDKLHIKMTAVNNEDQNKGYGRKLMEFAIKESKKKPIFTEVKCENFKTINICLKKGFKIIRYNEKLNEYILQYII